MPCDLVTRLKRFQLLKRNVITRCKVRTRTFHCISSLFYALGHCRRLVPITLIVLGVRSSIFNAIEGGERADAAKRLRKCNDESHYLTVNQLHGSSIVDRSSLELRASLAIHKYQVRPRISRYGKRDTSSAESIFSFRIRVRSTCANEKYRKTWEKFRSVDVAANIEPCCMKQYFQRRPRLPQRRARIPR